MPPDPIIIIDCSPGGVRLDLDLAPQLPRVVVIVDVVDGARLLERLEASAGEIEIDASRLHQVAVEVAGGDHPVLLAALVNARPVAVRLATMLEPGDMVQFVCVGGRGGVRVDDLYGAGRIIRLLLEELEFAAVLTDGAGVAVAITGSYDDPLSALRSSHDPDSFAGPNPANASVLLAAAQVDSVGVVAELVAGATGHHHREAVRVTMHTYPPQHAMGS